MRAMRTVNLGVSIFRGYNAFTAPCDDTLN
jgi:hypothetical protein